MRIDSIECPDECREYEKYVYGSEQIILKSKLKVSEGKVEYKVKDEWHSDHARQLFCINFIKHRSVCRHNNGVEHSPHRSKEPGGRRPYWFD